MTQNRRSVFNPISSARPLKPLERLERVQPVYFFTPDLEREINKLDGVTSCRVLSTGVEIEEIHVISPLDRTPKKVVRDIESLLLVHFGIRIDHRKISIVQVGQEATPVPALVRPRIMKVEKRTTREGCEGSVEIDLNGRTFLGVVQAQPEESELHLGSRALILALEQLLNRPGALSLQEIAQVSVGSQNVVISLVRSTLGEQEELLVGATTARGEPLEDAARATFDAVNRKLVRAHPPRHER